MERFKGATDILQVVMWAAGVSVAVAGASSTIIFNKFTGQDTRIYQQAQDIGSLKAQTERIPVIENKLDALLVNRGINPDKIKE